MSLYTWMASRLFFPLHERLKSHSTVAVRKVMEETQWYDAERLEQLQILRLRDMLYHCQEHVPYYRDIFKAMGVKPERVDSLDVLQDIPFLTKDIIRAAGDDLKADNAEGLARFNTGGSTGEPLIFYIGNRRVSHDVAAKWRATRWWGVDIGDPEIVVWGSPIELGSQDRVRAIRDKILRTKLIPAFEMSEQNLDRFVADIRSMKPKMLFGYPSSLSVIAGHAEKKGISMDDLGIKVAFVTSERLYDNQRSVIERVFGCPVANGYGGRDAGFLAHQCPEGGMHITADDVIVEIIGKDDEPVAPGEAGEVVVTHLATHDFPFVRYRTGDVAVLDDKPCACGRGLPLLKEIQGRTTDFIVAADGTLMHGLALIYEVRDVPGVAEFKIVQESLTHTRLLLDTDDAFESTSIDAIRSGFQKRLGAEVSIDIEQVDEIPREKSGKFRYVVSHVAP